MVCRLGEPSADDSCRLRYSDDPKADEPSVHLPLIQCRECRVTGWGAVWRPAEQRVDQDLRVFYNRFFSRDIDVRYLFPADPLPGVRGVSCLDFGMQDVYGTVALESPTWFGQLYRQTAIRRIVAAEHTALIEREERDRLQERFADPSPKPWEPNVLSVTPTLELGIDIGGLSTVVMCSVPPAPKNFQQRTGRAGRRDCNALTVTVAIGQPHDLRAVTRLRGRDPREEGAAGAELR